MEELKIGQHCLVTDYVANGSFKSLRENVDFTEDNGFAILVRLTDFTKGWNGEYKYVTQESYNFLKKSSLKVGDLVIANVGTVGKTFLVPDLSKPMTLGPNSILVRPISGKISTKFLKYYFDSKTGKDLIQSIVSGTTQRKFNKTKFRELCIYCPPLSEQKLIIAKVDSAFAKIEQLDSRKKEVFQQQQKLEENFYKVIFKSLEEEYGLIKLEEGIELISGQHIMSKDYNSDGDGIGYLTGPADFGIVYPVVSKFTLKPKKTAVKNDILITLKGSGIGKVNIMDRNELAISRQLAAIRPIKFDPLYLFIFLKTKFDYFQKLGNGAAIPGLSRVDVQTIEIPKVPIEKQQETLVKLQKFELLKSRYKTLQNLKSQELNSLKSAILSKELQAKTI